MKRKVGIPTRLRLSVLMHHLLRSRSRTEAEPAMMRTTALKIQGQTVNPRQRRVTEDQTLR